MKRAKPIPKKRLRPRRGPVRDAKYLAWIRTQPCATEVVHFGRIEAAHVGPRGLSQKCSDREAIPLCSWHHRFGQLSYHRIGKRFWKVHNLDREQLIADLNRRYDFNRDYQEEHGKPATDA